MKRAILLIMMMISSFGFYSFKDGANGDDVKTCYASFYSDSLNGSKTANGERYNSKAFTAAHRSLPFGTKLKLTNPKNGKSVVVRINDRGPFHASRSLDLSRAAFAEIGNPKSGVIALEYEIID